MDEQAEQRHSMEHVCSVYYREKETDFKSYCLDKVMK